MRNGLPVSFRLIAFTIAVVAGIFLLWKVRILSEFYFLLLGLIYMGPPLWRRIFWKRVEGEVLAPGEFSFSQAQELVYCYSVGAETYEGISYSTPNWHKKWQKINVDFMPGQPSVSKYTSNPSEFSGWVFLLVSAFFLFASR